MTLETDTPKPLTDLWAPGEDLLLQQRVGEGVSFPLIAVELGRSRHACIGRAHRLGLVHPNQTKRSSGFVKSRLPMGVTSKSLAPGAQLKSFADLKLHGECRFPHGDGPPESFLFCAAPTAIAPYCEFHHALTHSKSW